MVLINNYVLLFWPRGASYVLHKLIPLMYRWRRNLDMHIFSFSLKICQDTPLRYWILQSQIEKITVFEKLLMFYVITGIREMKIAA